MGILSIRAHLCYILKLILIHVSEPGRPGTAEKKRDANDAPCEYSAAEYHPAFSAIRSEGYRGWGIRFELRSVEK